MSKRYGRNQKRAAAAKLADLQHALDMNNGLHSHMRRRLDNYEATIKTVVRVLGPHFYGLPVVKREVDTIRHNYQMPKIDQEQAFSMMGADIQLSLVRHSINTLDVMTCSTKFDKLKESVHIVLQTPDGKIGYAISESALNQAQYDDVLPHIIQMIAKEMTELFVRNKNEKQICNSTTNVR